MSPLSPLKGTRGEDTIRMDKAPPLGGGGGEVKGTLLQPVPDVEFGSCPHIAALLSCRFPWWHTCHELFGRFTQLEQCLFLVRLIGGVDDCHDIGERTIALDHEPHIHIGFYVLLYGIGRIHEMLAYVFVNCLTVSDKPGHLFCNDEHFISLIIVGAHCCVGRPFLGIYDNDPTQSFIAI